MKKSKLVLAGIKRGIENITVQCAFCNGEGKDPFGLLSPLASCQVCGGTGEVTVQKPAVKCVFCGATGIYRDQRLTCTVCGGKGMVTVYEPSRTCLLCNGKGVVPHDYLPCIECGGKGVVAVKAAQTNERMSSAKL